MDPNPFETANAGFAQIVYEQFLRDPDSVSVEWRRLFESGVVGMTPSEPTEREIPVEPDGALLSVGLPEGAEPIAGPAARLVTNMMDSLTVPTATSFRDVPVGELERRRRQLNEARAAAGQPGKISYTHLIGHALMVAARSHAVMAHSFRLIDGVPHRITPPAISLGLAVDIVRKDGSRGLVVPVIRDATSKNFAEFYDAYEILVDKARTHRLMPDDFVGATITLTNPGGLGTVGSVPRLMAHQGTIVAVGAIDFPVAFAASDRSQLDALRLSKVMTLTSTYDHRVIQGAESGEFLREVDRLLQGGDDFYQQLAADVGLVVPAIGPAERRAAIGRPAGIAAPISPDQLVHVAAGMRLVRTLRTFGHLAAHLDPLGSPPIGDPSLEPSSVGLTAEIMASIPADVFRVAVPGETLAEALRHLEDTYSGTIAYEVEHIDNHEERVWLRQVIESGVYRTSLAPEGQRRLLARLSQVEALEQFLHKAYLGHKRFSIEGVDATVPMLDLAIETAAERGAREVVIGMAHRGRLNVLAHTVGKPYETIFAEFEGGRHVEAGKLTPPGGMGDVKYHHGAEGAYRTSSGRAITITLSPNPSHLEFVNPVVCGRARAEQTQRQGQTAAHDPSSALPILIHGDAAFAGEGIVAETLNLSALRGYGTGGTLHIITNNQIGFTTDIQDARSTYYASDLAKGFDLPIVHVNADDPEACLDAVRLAMAYRQRFHKDVLIDLVGYRRHGHNEGDEPAYTQPLMAARIKDLPTVRERFTDRLIQAGVLEPETAAREYDAVYQRLVETHNTFKAASPTVTPVEELERAGRPSGLVPSAVPAELLLALNEQLLEWPDDFAVHPKLAKQLERRRGALGGEPAIEWAHAEALAFASLLTEGVALRLTGQDTERGTFSQRHLVLHDVTNGQTYAPIQHLPGALASMEIHNSPLSEMGALGFEYGYAAAAPDTLVLWEAQFGDFINSAQVIVDQFIASSLSKWGVTSRLTLLLPHGYEGQGPEHSSARIERFLDLGAEHNMRIANCTTPGQYFHLLRLQALRKRSLPLVIMTPKSLLRLPQALSSFGDLSSGLFCRVLDNTALTPNPNEVHRVLLCSGKIYYDLLA
ncbi:MAG: multifunctional oxoglutarate decarboxylase/oxoglutarate dehydrogenase thiamine pyrophosphate-binding subunit/dihydrolipoyllysine-residue succinyltransferase subunit, partial [Gemmatimonadales bacterium]|nr:multifunctional oxoglutarate decarboxylase/oxoglutarate dehydrogenase thiamine pyrophosphate-binding subunit/dihydrolipoyllysine-residue succinyltransferase subunit [Gemmatimonadales bacterium]